MQKLQVALDMYRGLGSVPATRSDTLAKVKSMLLHPFSKVSGAAGWWMHHGLYVDAEGSGADCD